MIDKFESRKRFIINVLFFAIAAAMLYFGVKYVLGWILPFLIGLLVAMLLRPIISFISMKCRIPNKVAAVFLILLFYAIFGLLLILIVNKLIIALESGVAALPTVYRDYLEPLFNDLFEKLKVLAARLDPNMVQSIQNITSNLSATAGSLVSTGSSAAIKALSSTVTSVPGILLAILLSIISSVFFSMDFPKIREYVMALFPEKIRQFIHQLKVLAGDIVFKYVKSYSILISITFVELSIGLLIMGVDNAIAIAALIALIDILPVVGTGGIVIPWAIIELLKENIGFAAGLAIMYIVILVVRNILEPKIVGDQIGVHPLAMLISMYLGLQIFGFIGIFVFPILLVVVKGVYDIRKKDEQHSQGSVDKYN